MLHEVASSELDVVRVARWDWAKGGTTGAWALPTAKDLETGKFFNDRAVRHRQPPLAQASRRSSIGENYMTLTENDLAMIREMGRGFNEPELDRRRLSPARGVGRFRSREITFAPQALPSWRGDEFCASLGLNAAVRNGAGWRDAARRYGV